MERYIKILGFLLVSFLCCHGSNQVEDTAVAVPQASCTLAVATDADSFEDTLQEPLQLEYPCYAELGGFSTQTSLIQFLRVQRNHFFLTYVSLKTIIQRLALRYKELSNSLIELCDLSLFYRCSPVNQYYVFTLKKILI